MLGGCKVIKVNLLLYELILGLKLNFQKILLVGINMSASWLYEASQVLKLQVDQVPFKYIGLSVGGNPHILHN